MWPQRERKRMKWIPSLYKTRASHWFDKDIDDDDDDYDYNGIKQFLCLSFSPSEWGWQLFLLKAKSLKNKKAVFKDHEFIPPDMI